MNEAFQKLIFNASKYTPLVAEKNKTSDKMETKITCNANNSKRLLQDQ
jgi:hypothetical protein